MSLLDKIALPTDLKKLDKSELPQLAEEIRSFLINNVSKTGGHLAPSLGVVELTLALHSTFDTPKDKIIWDVGHQSYVHKILTGRKESFHTLRQYQGISGFPKRSESEHDAFGTGHSSTSISAALGIALARDLNKENFEVVAVIGDGALTGGMALEALNNAGDLAKKVIVVLNDNEMSIAKNVGAMSEYLYRMRTAPTYSRIKRDVEVILKGIPSIGEQVMKTAERVKDSLKYLLVPGMLFEDLGFTYIGPIDGHNLDNLLEIMEKAKNLSGPVLVHVLTCKGKGYLPAETNPDKFHGIGAFCVETGEKIVNPNAPPTYTEIFSETILDLAAKDERIVTITAAMPDGTGLRAFSKRYPDRFFDVGIAEQHAMTLAAGMASQGLKPVIALYSTFAQRAYDQILHDICLQNLPVIIALDRAGLVGDDGATHHGVFDLSYLTHIPNIIIMAPQDERQLRDMLYTAVELNAPVAIRYPRGSGVGVCMNQPIQKLPVGKAQVLRAGEDAVIVAVGCMVEIALKAADILSGKGINVGVVNACFVKPFDNILFAQLAKEKKKLVVLEENAKIGGFAALLLAFLNEHNYIMPHSFLSIGIEDEFVPHGGKGNLYKHIGIDADSVADKVEDFVKAGVTV